MAELETIGIRIDEMEAMRLVDAEGHSQTEAAQHMGVSQPTIARLLDKGRCKLIGAVVHGQAFSIEHENVMVEFYGRAGRGRCCGRRGFGAWAHSGTETRPPEHPKRKDTSCQQETEQDQQEKAL